MDAAVEGKTSIAPEIMDSPIPVLGKGYPTYAVTDCLVRFPTLVLATFIFLPLVFTVLSLGTDAPVDTSPGAFTIADHISARSYRAVSDAAEDWEGKMDEFLANARKSRSGDQRTDIFTRLFVAYEVDAAAALQYLKQTGRINMTTQQRLEYLSLLSDSNLRYIHQVERHITTQLEQYSKMCWSAQFRGGPADGAVPFAKWPQCTPPNSALTWFYPGALYNSTTPKHWAFDLAGNLQTPLPRVQELFFQSGNYRWFVDQAAGPKHQYVHLLRSQFAIGTPFDASFGRSLTKLTLEEKVTHVDGLLNDMISYLQNVPQHSYIRVSFGGPRVEQALAQASAEGDTARVFLCLLIVFPVLWYYFHSFVLSFLSTLMLAMIYPMGFFLYVAGSKSSVKLSLLTALSFLVTLVMSVNAMMIFFDTFRQSGFMPTTGRRNLLTVAQRIAYAYRKAGVGISIASIIVIICFLVNTSSKVPAVRDFCGLAAVFVAINWVQLMTFFPAAVLFHHFHVSRKRRNLQKQKEVLLERGLRVRDPTFAKFNTDVEKINNKHYSATFAELQVQATRSEIARKTILAEKKSGYGGDANMANENIIGSPLNADIFDAPISCWDSVKTTLQGIFGEGLFDEFSYKEQHNFKREQEARRAEMEHQHAAGTDLALHIDKRHEDRRWVRWGGMQSTPLGDVAAGAGGNSAFDGAVPGTDDSPDAAAEQAAARSPVSHQLRRRTALDGGDGGGGALFPESEMLEMKEDDFLNLFADAPAETEDDDGIAASSSSGMSVREKMVWRHAKNPDPLRGSVQDVVEISGINADEMLAYDDAILREHLIELGHTDFAQFTHEHTRVVAPLVGIKPVDERHVGPERLHTMVGVALPLLYGKGRTLMACNLEQLRSAQKSKKNTGQRRGSVDEQPQQQQPGEAAKPEEEENNNAQHHHHHERKPMTHTPTTHRHFHQRKSQPPADLDGDQQEKQQQQQQQQSGNNNSNAGIIEEDLSDHELFDTKEKADEEAAAAAAAAEAHHTISTESTSSMQRRHAHEASGPEKSTNDELQQQQQQQHHPHHSHHHSKKPAPPPPKLSVKHPHKKPGQPEAGGAVASLLNRAGDWWKDRTQVQRDGCCGYFGKRIDETPQERQRRILARTIKHEGYSWAERAFFNDWTAFVHQARFFILLFYVAMLVFSIVYVTDMPFSHRAPAFLGFRPTERYDELSRAFGEEGNCDYCSAYFAPTAAMPVPSDAAVGICAATEDLPKYFLDVDVCGKCGTENACLDCAATPNGGYALDSCGQCVNGSSPVKDQCGACLPSQDMSCSYCRVAKGSYSYLTGPNCATQCDTSSCVNGVCNPFSGHCDCFQDPGRGYWGGSKCDACLDGWWGVNCKTSCTTTGAKDICSCFFGSCTTCPNGYAGEACAYRRPDVCSVDGGTISEATGWTCQCNAGFSGSICAGHANCSGHGRVLGTPGYPSHSELHGTCGCFGQWRGPACEYCRCYNGGVCAYDGTCQCAAGWSGVDCQECATTCQDRGGCPLAPYNHEHYDYRSCRALFCNDAELRTDTATSSLCVACNTRWGNNNPYCAYDDSVSPATCTGAPDCTTNPPDPTLAFNITGCHLKPDYAQHHDCKCRGNWYGDSCKLCNKSDAAFGRGTYCREIDGVLLGCDGQPKRNGRYIFLDSCDTCGGSSISGTQCKGCDGIIGSEKVVDRCGVCGGFNDCVNSADVASGSLIKAQSTIVLAWGLQPYDDESETASATLALLSAGGRPALRYWPKFDLGDATVLSQLEWACDSLLKETSFVKASQTRCFVKDWKAWVILSGGNSTWPVLGAAAAQSAYAFARAKGRFGEIGFSSFNNNASNFKALWVQVHVRPVSLFDDDSRSHLEEQWRLWNGLKNKLDAGYTEKLGPSVLGSSAFVALFSLRAAVLGTIFTTVLGCSVFATMILAVTCSLFLSVCCFLVLVGNVLFVLAMFRATGWEIGPIEQVSIALLMGVVSERVIHMCISYMEYLHRLHSHWFAQEATRLQAVRNTMQRVGVSLAASSVTIIIGSCIALSAELYVIRRIAIIVIIIVATQLLYALLVMPAMLVVMGPVASRTSAGIHVFYFIMGCIFFLLVFVPPAATGAIALV